MNLPLLVSLQADQVKLAYRRSEKTVCNVRFRSHSGFGHGRDRASRTRGDAAGTGVHSSRSYGLGEERHAHLPYSIMALVDYHQMVQ